MINKNILAKSLKNFYENKPINYCVIDNFFEKRIALKLEKEFPHFSSNIWHEYNNPLEIKKTCNQWNLFTPLIYICTRVDDDFITPLNKMFSIY